MGRPVSVRQYLDPAFQAILPEALKKNPSDRTELELRALRAYYRLRYHRVRFAENGAVAREITPQNIGGPHMNDHKNMLASFQEAEQTILRQALHKSKANRTEAENVLVRRYWTMSNVRRKQLASPAGRVDHRCSPEYHAWLVKNGHPEVPFQSRLYMQYLRGGGR